jgi:hypothetical protein
LERLELERPELVTTRYLAALLDELNVGTVPRVFAARLRAKGWLLATAQRGVWEFAPAAVAGPYSTNDPLLPLKSFLARRPDALCGLTLQASAWAHGLADRVPIRPEVAAAEVLTAKRLPAAVAGSVFTPALDYVLIRGVPVLGYESVLVHMCTRPAVVRSWTSAQEWLPELASQLTWPHLESELSVRTGAVRARVGYLIQGLRPDLSEGVAKLPMPTGKTWFGGRRPLLRHDNRWQIADTLLPFDPKRLGAVQ